MFKLLRFSLNAIKGFIPQFLAVAFLFFVFIYPSSSSLPASILQSIEQPVKNELASPSSDPASYEVTIVQTGGIGSQDVAMYVVGLTPKTNFEGEKCSDYTSPVTGECYPYLYPAENYASTRFFGPGLTLGGQPSWVSSEGELMVYCKKGYVLTRAQSPSGNQLDLYFIGVPEFGVGLEIQDKPRNAIQILCEKEEVSEMIDSEPGLAINAGVGQEVV